MTLRSGIRRGAAPSQAGSLASPHEEVFGQAQHLLVVRGNSLIQRKLQKTRDGSSPIRVGSTRRTRQQREPSVSADISSKKKNKDACSYVRGDRDVMVAYASLKDDEAAVDANSVMKCQKSDSSRGTTRMDTKPSVHPQHTKNTALLSTFDDTQMKLSSNEEVLGQKGVEGEKTLQHSLEMMNLKDRGCTPLEPQRSPCYTQQFNSLKDCSDFNIPKAEHWLQRPHTVTALCATLAIIWLASHFVQGKFELRENIVIGVFACIFMFLVFATLQLPDGVMVRPSRAFWRLMMGVSMLYLLLLIFLLFQNLDDIRRGLAYYDPSLGKPLIEKNYGQNCNSWATFRAQIDVFVSAHFFGWLVKAMVLRDAKLLWFLSVLYEWMEITFRNVLPNFWECWWDHLILDICGCNLLGMYFGLKLNKVFNLKTFDWRLTNHDMKHQNTQEKSNEDALTSSDSSSNLSLQLLSKSTNLFEHFMVGWFPFLGDFQAFLAVLFVSIITTVVDLNVFFLKALLWIDTSHKIIIARTFFWGIVSASGVREFHDFMMGNPDDKMGIQCWLDLAMVSSELLIVVRWSSELKAHYPCPRWILVCWLVIVAIVLMAAAQAVRFIRRGK